MGLQGPPGIKVTVKYFICNGINRLKTQAAPLCTVIYDNFFEKGHL